MRRATFVLALLVFALPLLAADPAPPLKDPRAIDAALPDLSDFRTVDGAVSTRIARAAPTGVTTQPGYAGICLERDPLGHLVIAQIDPGSPAEKAGLQVGDRLQQIEGQATQSESTIGEMLRSKPPGESVKLALVRDNKPMELTVTLAATSRPLTTTGQRASLGITVSEVNEGLKIDRLSNNSAAGDAGVKVGDVLVKIDEVAVTAPDKLSNIINDKQPGELVKLVLKREGKEMEISVKLGTSEGFDPNRLRWDSSSRSLWSKPVYRLAVVAIEYPDVKHNLKVSTFDWEQALFSTGTYINKSATGQQVYGSLNDYYQEISCGAFSVEGKFFNWVTVEKKRNDYASDTNRGLLTEALNKLYERDGKDALKEFDGIYFVYAGDRVQTNRGGLYWPHRATLTHGTKRWAYFICPEGGSRMGSISVVSHEFGHMLGLPDLYARPESPGSEGLGVWCTMSTGHGRDGKPLHFSAWCKEQLGWLKPALIDPTVKQKLILAPIEGSTRECFKVLVRADGSEYLLLENRLNRGYDRDLPGEGLLIWRVVDGRPVLEESHGIAGPEGPGRFLGSIPFPSKSNTAFTPYTTPSSRSQKGGGLPVHITNIRRLPDGRVTFYVGYEYL